MELLRSRINGSEAAPGMRNWQEDTILGRGSRVGARRRLVTDVQKLEDPEEMEARLGLLRRSKGLHLRAKGT